MTSDDRDPATEKAVRVRELLADAVLTEVQMINAGMEYRLSETAVDTIARAVASRINYAFEVSWSPDWVAPGGPHKWNDRDGWRADSVTLIWPRGVGLIWPMLRRTGVFMSV